MPSPESRTLTIQEEEEQMWAEYDEDQEVFPGPREFAPVELEGLEEAAKPNFDE